MLTLPPSVTLVGLAFTVKWWQAASAIVGDVAISAANNAAASELPAINATQRCRHAVSRAPMLRPKPAISPPSAPALVGTARIQEPPPPCTASGYAAQSRRLYWANPGTR